MGKKRPPLPPWVEHAALVRKKLKDRGFRPTDKINPCETCGEGAQEAWGLGGGGQGMGGRDIVYCMACGASRSHKGSLGGKRIVEENFDLLGFLGIQGSAPGT